MEYKLLQADDCIECRVRGLTYSDFRHNDNTIQVYHGKTESISDLGRLRTYLSEDELKRCERFRFDSDRNTYIASHSILRLLVSKHLDVHPLDLEIITDENGKPYIPGNPLYFNISHTRQRFSIALSDNYCLGVDIEYIRHNIDIPSMTGNYFNRKESEKILSTGSDQRNKFFLFWTRKEAILKAIGTGIVNDLHSIQVSESVNYIDSGVYKNSTSKPVSGHHFIYSMRINDHFMSVAVPYISVIKVFTIDDVFLESLT